MAALKIELQQVLRFGLVGAANTTLTYVLIVLCLYSGFGDYPANLVGFAAGVVLSYLLNGFWTFRARGTMGAAQFVKYLAVVAVAYGANLGIIFAARKLGFIDHPLTHLAGMAAYTPICYVGVSRFVFAQSESGARNIAGQLKSFWPEFAVLAVVLGVTPYFIGIPLTPDVSWQFWIARQMLDGARLYTDIVEVNPPLWFWMAIPLQRLGDLAGFGWSQMAVAAILLCIAISLLLTARFIAHISASRRAVFYGFALIAMAIAPIHFFAQREHLVFITSVPFAALSAARANERQVSWQLSLAIGLFASIGFAMKHYFVVVPVLLELWLIWQLRHKWNPLRLEMIILALSAITYALSVRFFAPEYLTSTIPDLLIAYDGFNVPVKKQVLSLFIFVWILPLLILWAARKELSATGVSLTVCALGFAASYFLQDKGWAYHAIPATGFLILAMGLVISEIPVSRPKMPIFWQALKLSNVSLAMAAILGLAWASGPFKTPFKAATESLLDGVPRNRPVMMLTTEVVRIFPMVIDGHYIWPTRYFGYWMVPSLMKFEKLHGKLDPQRQDLADRVIANTLADFTCNPPEVLILDYAGPAGYGPTNVFQFLGRSPEFMAFFSHYQATGSVRRLVAFKKRKDWKPDRAAVNCRGFVL